MRRIQSDGVIALLDLTGRISKMEAVITVGGLFIGGVILLLVLTKNTRK
jgi:hypothetical protein